MHISERIFGLWPTISEMAHDLGVSEWNPYKWRQRRPFIPPSKYDCKIIQRAKSQNVEIDPMEIISQRADPTEPKKESAA